MPNTYEVFCSQIGFSFLVYVRGCDWVSAVRRLFFFHGFFSCASAFLSLGSHPFSQILLSSIFPLGLVMFAPLCALLHLRSLRCSKSEFLQHANVVYMCLEVMMLFSHVFVFIASPLFPSPLPIVSLSLALSCLIDT